MKSATDSAAPTPPRLSEIESAPQFKSELHERRWTRKLTNRQEQLDAAWAKYTPGTLLYVSAARGIPLRTRAGVGFTGKATTTVEVSGQSDAEIAARVARGEAIVSPLGASAITRDDGLIVHSGPQLAKSGDEAAKAAEDRAELIRLRGEVARLTRTAAPESTDGRPSRLAPPADKGKDKSGDFGDKG